MLSDLFSAFFSQIEKSVELLVWIAIALLLRPVDVKKFLPYLGLVVIIQMILQPVIAIFFADLGGGSVMVQEVLFLTAAMPSGAIAAPLVICTYLLSLVTLPVMLILLG